jgi:HPt (histidine-containing phosphotransfer) domain-containing protein
LKSSSRTLGLDQLGEQCFNIEQAAEAQKNLPDTVAQLRELREQGLTQLKTFIQKRSS